MARTQKPANKRTPPTQQRARKQPSEPRGSRAGREDDTEGGKTTIRSDAHGNSGERETREHPQQEVHPDDHDDEGT